MFFNEYKDVNHSVKPLEQWYCDECGGVIESAEDGWLEWYRDVHKDHSKEKGFRIVHHDKLCMYDSKEMYHQYKRLIADTHLDRFIGSDGLVHLLSKVQHEYVEDNAELVEIIRRLHVPYYEEARMYHEAAESDGYFDGENELTRYITRTSKYILNNYKTL